MSCCAKPTREQFLTEKLANFRKYVEPFCTTEEMKAALTSYSTLDAAMPFLLQAVMLRQSSGSVNSAVDAFCSKFDLGDQADAFREKVARYIGMFTEVLTS